MDVLPTRSSYFWGIFPEIWPLGLMIDMIGTNKSVPEMAIDKGMA